MVGGSEVHCEKGQRNVHKGIGKFGRRGKMSLSATFFFNYIISACLLQNQPFIRLILLVHVST